MVVGTKWHCQPHNPNLLDVHMNVTRNSTAMKMQWLMRPRCYDMKSPTRNTGPDVLILSRTTWLSGSPGHPHTVCGLLLVIHAPYLQMRKMASYEFKPLKRDVLIHQLLLHGVPCGDCGCFFATPHDAAYHFAEHARASHERYLPHGEYCGVGDSPTTRTDALLSLRKSTKSKDDNVLRSGLYVVFQMTSLGFEGVCLL